MDNQALRERALSAIKDTTWIPEWGANRITGMIAGRPDWCLSRQRAWGVPVIALRCTKCQVSVADARIARHVADLFETAGSDVWFTSPVERLVPPGFKCASCGGAEFAPERDILDVWFDSGVSFAAVVEKDFGPDRVADLYLEGSDQHRGWFHSALLASVATRGRAPYKAVLTHGFILDGEGRKMSKSVGNVVAPQKLVEQYGADILRLWVAAEDYRDDVRISDEILKRLADSYRRIRNTARNLLANLYDFDPTRDASRDDELDPLDNWALDRLDDLIFRCRKAYEDYEFHVVYHALNNFCGVDMSALYFDIVKDRVYCSAPASRERRAAQTAMYRSLSALARLIAPILSFTADEIWRAIPGQAADACVLLTDFPEARDKGLAELRRHGPVVTREEAWPCAWRIRSEVTRSLEEKRKSGELGQSLEAKVRIRVPPQEEVLLGDFGVENLAAMYIVSAVEIVPDPKAQQVSVEVLVRPDAKCARCWRWLPSVGAHSDHPELCDRCYDVVAAAS
jgi:isoleucyl-tRNA synthetase